MPSHFCFLKCADDFSTQLIRFRPVTNDRTTQRTPEKKTFRTSGRIPRSFASLLKSREHGKRPDMNTLILRLICVFEELRNYPSLTYDYGKSRQRILSLSGSYRSWSYLINAGSCLLFTTPPFNVVFVVFPDGLIWESILEFELFNIWIVFKNVRFVSPTAGTVPE